MTIAQKGHTLLTEAHSRTSKFSPGQSAQRRNAPSRSRSRGNRPLRVMKFGGTSVGDASAIRRVLEIIQGAARESDLVVVVSAMAGVTNQLAAAASRAEAGNREAVATIFAQLRHQHGGAASALVRSAAERSRMGRALQEWLQLGERLCQDAILRRQLTPGTRDSITGLGERLSVLLVAAALADSGMSCTAIEATELVVTNACHGSADPVMELTRARSEARLRPLLQQGVTPVVTGFIGATPDGILTTLGRGGSDYSATILGAALEADEVIIWTDVDGLHTADPRQVPEARTIPHISYREAAELAYFGAKVLHPKTLRPVLQRGIPLWIRNTFAPDQLGTKITPAGPPAVAGVKALTASSDVAMIALGGSAVAGAPDIAGRAARATASVRADLLLFAQASSQNHLCLVISSALARPTLEALRREFAHEPAELFRIDDAVAMVTLVGQNMSSIPGIAGRTLGAMARENVNILAIAPSASEGTISFVVAKPAMQVALSAIHREFRLGSPLHGDLNRDLASGENCYPHRKAFPASQIPGPGD